MTTQYVAGAAPVTFISEDVGGNAGKQYQIPLSALAVNSSNQIDPSTWASDASLSSTDTALVTALISSLTQQGFLTVVTTS
jgi:hypothetical protein